MVVLRKPILIGPKIIPFLFLFLKANNFGIYLSVRKSRLFRLEKLNCPSSPVLQCNAMQCAMCNSAVG